MPGPMQVRKSSAARKLSRAARIEVPSGSVLHDLGLVDADDISAKVHLAIEVNRVLDRNGWTQAYAARVFGIAQPHVSELRNYKLRHFSTDRLIGFLCRLNIDVDIVVRSPEEGRGGGILTVKREAA